MQQALKNLIETSSDGTKFLWKQVLMDTSLWPILSYSEGTLLSCSDYTVCLLLTTCRNKVVQKQRECKGSFSKK